MKLFNQLVQSFTQDYIQALEENYLELNEEYIKNNHISFVMVAGHICEIISSMLCYAYLNQIENLNSISFDNNINSLIRSPKTTDPKEDIIKLMIPYVLRSIFTIRNKKKVGHYKSLKTEDIDIRFIKNAIDWVISQLFLIFSNQKTHEILNFLQKAQTSDIFFVEQFENEEYIFYDDKLSDNDKILYILSVNYNTGRITKAKIIESVPELNKSYLTKNIKRLEERKLIHINSTGIKLTTKGIAWVTNKIRKRITLP